MRGGGTALDAVEQAVRALEDDALFNAGRGAVFTHDATHELDAAITSGADRRAGAVCCVRNVKNPVSLARRVMDSSPHVLLCGEGATLFAREQEIEFAPDEYFFDEYRHRQLLDALREDQINLDHSDDKSSRSEISSHSDEKTDEKKFGTVGAVALDSHGHHAAATQPAA